MTGRKGRAGSSAKNGKRFRARFWRRPRSAERGLRRARPGAHAPARARARSPLFLHGDRALWHELLDAAGDPDFRSLAACDRLCDRDSLFLRHDRHGAVGGAFGPDRRAHLACRAAAHRRRRGLRLVRLAALARADPGRAHFGDVRHLCRGQHVLVAADLDPRRHGRRSRARADQFDGQCQRAGGTSDHRRVETGDGIVHGGTPVSFGHAHPRRRDRASLRRRRAHSASRVPAPPAKPGLRRAASSVPRRSAEAANRRGYRARRDRRGRGASSAPCRLPGAPSARRP